MSNMPLEVPSVAPKVENHFDGEIHLPYQGNDTLRRLKRDKEEKMDTQEISNACSQRTREDKMETEPAFIQQCQRKTRLDGPSTETVERDRSPLRSQNPSQYNLRSKKEIIRPDTTPNKNGYAHSRGAYRSTVSTGRSNRGSTKTARRVSNRASKRGRAGKTVTSVARQTDAEVCISQDHIPPVQQMNGDLEYQQPSAPQQTSTLETSNQQSCLSLPQISPQTTFQQPNLQHTTPQETCTSQTSSQQTSFEQTTPLQTSTPQISLETFTPPTTLQEKFTPPTILQDTFTPQKSLQETFTPPTSLQEMFTPQTSLQEKFTPPTILQETFTQPTILQETFPPQNQEIFPPTVLQELLTPQTSLQEKFTPPTTFQEKFTPQTIIQETFTPQTNVHETFTPQTALQEAFIPPTTPEEIFTPQTTFQELFTPQTILQETFTLQTSFQETFTPKTSLQTNKTDKSKDESCDKMQPLFNPDLADALNFNWDSMPTYTGTKENFLPQKTGPVRQVPNAYEAFRMFWDDEILDHIATQTNNNAMKIKAASIPFANEWYDTNRNEIMILFAFWIMLGVIRMPTITACFCTHPILKMDIFRIMMTHSRYQSLNRALYFSDSATRSSNSSKLFHLGPIPEHLNKKFKESYIPDQNITIGETLTSWGGHLPFTQYINNRPGIKTVELCESKTGYLWSFFINTDKNTTSSTQKIQRGTEIVVDLVKPLLNKGYNLFLDNWFVSPVLARYLKQNGTDCVGVMHRTRRDIPVSLQTLHSNPEGSCIAIHSQGVVAMLYKNKVPIYTISTYYTTEWFTNKDTAGNPTHSEPGLISEYNTNNLEVDTKYHTLSPYLRDVDTKTWPLKLFKKLLNASLFNSYILRKESQEEILCVIKKSLQKTAFDLELVNFILMKHLSLVHSIVDPREFPEMRFFGAHFIVLAPLEEGKRHRSRRFCTWCTFRQAKYSTTAYLCDTCNVPLCLKECFKKYHTIQ